MIDPAPSLAAQGQKMHPLLKPLLQPRLGPARELIHAFGPKRHFFLKVLPVFNSLRRSFSMVEADVFIAQMAGKLAWVPEDQAMATFLMV
jgi:hypothetical protein